MQSLLDYSLQLARQDLNDDSLCFKHFDLLPSVTSVRQYLVDLYKRLSSFGRRLHVAQLLVECENVHPAAIFTGCGAVFDLYFVMLGPANMHRRLMAARKAGVENFNAVREHIKKQLSGRFYYWVITACRSISQRACTRQLFYISLPTDFRGLSGETLPAGVVTPLHE